MDLNRLGRGVYGNAFARLFGLDDTNAVPTLAPEILPTTSLWERDEFWALVGGKLAAKAGQIGAVVGQYSAAYLINRADSGQLMIVDAIAGGVEMEWGLNQYLQLAGAPGVSREMRTQVAGGAAGMVAGIGGHFIIENAAALLHVPCAYAPAGRHHVSAVLKPGSLFGMNTVITNQAAKFSIEWRERSFSAAEMQLF